MDISDLYLAVEYGVSTSLLSDEPDRWVRRVAGEVFSYDEDDKALLVGRAEYLYIDLASALDDGISVGSMLDLTAETIPYLDALFDDELSEFGPEAIQAFGDDVWGTNLFVVNRLEILPECRGCRVAEVLIEDAVKIFGADAQLIVLQSFPLQLDSRFKENGASGWREGLKLEAFMRDERRAKRSLESYYESLGFKRFGKEGVMAKLNG